MEIKTPQELNLTQEKGVAWLEKTPKSPSEQPPLGWLGATDTLWGGGTPSPANTGGMEPFQPTNAISQESETHPQFRDTASRTELPRDTRGDETLDTNDTRPH